MSTPTARITDLGLPVLRGGDGRASTRPPPPPSPPPCDTTPNDAATAADPQDPLINDLAGVLRPIPVRLVIRSTPRSEVAMQPSPLTGLDTMTVIGTERGDYVALEGRGESEPDVLEMFAVESALEGDLPAMGSATGTSGALLGAAFATSLATAVLAVSHCAVPGGTRVHGALGERVRVVHGSTAEDTPVRSALVVGTDSHDQAGAVVVRAAEDHA